MAKEKLKNKKTEKQTSKKESFAKTPFVKSQGKQGEPQNMEDLLSSTGYQVHGLKRNDQREGTVTVITSRAVFVDIGAKTEGIIAEREYEAARDFIKTLKVGDKVTVRVIFPENDSGQAVLSLRGEAQTSGWKKILEALQKNEEIEVQVREAIKSGFLVSIQGLPGFIPTSQLSEFWQKKQGELIGRVIKVKVVEVDEIQNRVILSEKAVSEKEKIEKTRQVIGKIKEEEIFEGEITGITPFGVFAKIKAVNQEVEGLIHISELSWEKVENPESLYRVGDKVRVKVIGKDEKQGRLSFSAKQLTDDPWKDLVKKYAVDLHVSGKVLRLVASGAFLELEPGLEGFLHISKVPVEKKIQPGDTLECYVELIEPEKRRISLGLVLTKKPIGYK